MIFHLAHPLPAPCLLCILILNWIYCSAYNLFLLFTLSLPQSLICEKVSNQFCFLSSFGENTIKIDVRTFQMNKICTSMILGFNFTDI